MNGTQKKKVMNKRMKLFVEFLFFLRRTISTSTPAKTAIATTAPESTAAAKTTAIAAAETAAAAATTKSSAAAAAPIETA